MHTMQTHCDRRELAQMQGPLFQCSYIKNSKDTVVKSQRLINLVAMITLKFFFVIGVLFLTCTNNIESLRTYKIGGLFHKDSNETETAFECAIRHFNRFNSDINFSSKIKHISRGNSFTVCQSVCNMLKEDDEGLIALFGPPSTEVAGIVNSLSSSLELPNMQIHPPSTIWPYERSHVMTINVYPNVYHLQKGIGTIVENLQWKTYAILYENQASITRLQEVIKLSEIKEGRLILRQLIPPDYRVVLKEIKRLGYARIIIDFDAKFLMDILKQAQELDMLGYLHSYFITSLDTYTFDLSELNSMANITTIKIINSEEKYVHTFLRECNLGRLTYDVRTGTAKTAFVKTEPSLMWDAINFFMQSFYELHLTGEMTVEKLTCDGNKTGNDYFRLANYMKIRTIPDTVTGRIGFENNVRSSLMLDIVEMIQGQVTNTAVWNSTVPDRIFFIRTEKEHQEVVDLYMKNTTFIVSSRIGEPYLMRKKPTVPGEILEGNAAFEGFSLDIIDNIAKMLNFSYKFFITENNKHGSFNKMTKTWDGLIKDILDRRAHLAICDLTITQERRSAVDFSLPFMTLGISILYIKPKPQERDIFAFLDPLDPVVWVYIIAAYVSFTLALHFLTRIAPGDWENPRPIDPNPEELENIWDLKNCFWLTLGSTMSAGCDILPKGISSRMGISMWWFMILIISSSYTANLSAFLTTSRMGPTIDNAEDLAKQNKIKYGALNGGATQAFFKNSNFSTYQKMWTQMVQSEPNVFVKDNAEGVRRVKTTKNQLYAFLMESSSIEYEMERDCELKQVGGRLDNKGYGIAMPVNSPYRGAINNAILKMQEEGTLRRLKTKWWQEMHGGGSCKKELEVSSDMKLAIANIGGVFLVVGSGLGLAFLIAIAEFIWNIHVVAVEELKTYKEIFLNEVKFAISVWVSKKRTYKTSTSCTSLSNINGSCTPTTKSNGTT